MLKTVRLYGTLGKQFGREHIIAIDSPKEAIKALCVRCDGFEKFLNEAHLKGLEFAVFKGKRNISNEELHLTTSEEIRIAPIIKGNKRGGFFQTILGVALIGAAMLTGPAGWAAAFTAAGTWGGALALGGAAMALGGVVQMLAPQPPGLSTRQDADNKPSYAFGGVVNTTAQGNPAPVLYGTREIGGAIISAGIYTEDQQ
ncbi:tail assembly protein [Photorhabdus australis]|uniref:tail assembly protein n=1 Tax=Photorhabdus australis TaxID=286156 RepID=UPI0005635907|nr:tail assembly protein [Photorhabdus australis]